VFTGLVEALGTLTAKQASGDVVRVDVRAPEIIEGIRIGDSICNNGCCLTVVGIDNDLLSFDAVPETMQRTNLGSKNVGDRINLERSLKVGDRMGGHYVTGHIDGIGILDQRIDQDGCSKFWFSVPKELSIQMASKGSVAVDGVSLTLVDVQPGKFSVALIPHTLNMTTLGLLELNDAVNIETDVLAKYVQSAIIQYSG
jgi:riboflavin synthase